MIWNSAQSAIVKKDIREAVSTKSVKAVIMIVPLMMALVLPGMFTAMTYFLPGEMNDFDSMLSLMPVQFSLDDGIRAVYYYMMNYFMPVFFILIPVMASSIASGSSFAGEKERRTLATIIYSPLSVHQLFNAKVMAAFITAMCITGISFLTFLAVAITGSVLIYGGFVLNIGIWAVMLLLIAPSISLVGITLMVLASARAKNFQDAQQYSAILMVPAMMLMMIPQMAGLFVFDALKLVILGVVFLALGVGMMRLASVRFTPEKLLK